MTNIINGKELAVSLRAKVKTYVDEIKKKENITPGLAVILVGEDPASQVYVRNKGKQTIEAGMNSYEYKLDESTSRETLLTLIKKLNDDEKVHGILCQLPLPNHLNEEEVINSIDPKKDVDGFHPQNIGKMALNLPTFLPATPAGIVELIKRYNIDTEGKHCVVVGRSHIVGSPMSILMARNSYPGNCTVTLTHSRTTNLKELCLSADILIVALGRAEFITADMVKDGACVIDVGISRVKSDKTKSGWKLKGDVNYDDVVEKCDFITPVPGGVGPMTIAMLLKNTLYAVKGFN